MSNRVSLPLSLLAGSVLCVAAPLAVACPIGAPWGGPSELSLQQVFDQNIAVAPNANSACAPGAPADEVWKFSGTTGGASVIIELAGYANQNSFGMYDLADHSNRLTIFNGGDSAGSSRLITTGPPGGPYTFTVSGDSSSSTRTFSSSQFCFFLQSPDGGGTTFFSQAGANSGGKDQMLAYAGNGSAFIGASSALGYFNLGDYIVAWEDLLNGDNDYQDFVAVVRNVASVPLPAAAWLLFSGVAALGTFGRSRRRTLLV
jgi:hypothetical protein